MQERTQSRRRVNWLGRNLSDLGRGALQYAGAGIPVYRLRPKQSRRLRAAENEPATVDLEEVAARWVEVPDANVGFQPASVELLALDGDVHGADDGVSALVGVLESCGALDACIRANSAGGGVHAYFHCPAGVEVRAFLSDAKGERVRGIDVIRNQNIVLPPSVRSRGTYAWWDDSVTVATHVPRPVPNEILAMCRKRDHEDNVEPGEFGKPEWVENLEAYVESIVEKTSKALSTGERGERNNRLNQAAMALGRLVPGGFLGEDRIRDVLLDACGRNGLLEDDGERAFDRTFRSGLKAGIARPRMLRQKARAANPTQSGRGRRTSRSERARSTSTKTARSSGRPASTTSAPSSGSAAPPSSPPQPEESPSDSSNASGKRSSTPSPATPSPGSSEKETGPRVGPEEVASRGMRLRRLVRARTGRDPGEFPPTAGRWRPLFRGGDAAMAKMLAWALNGVWKYTGGVGEHGHRWFDGTKWESGPRAYSLLWSAAVEILPAVNVRLSDHVSRDMEKEVASAKKFRTVKSAIESAKHDSLVAARVSDWDADPNVVGIESGVVDLRTGEHREGHRAEDMISKICPVSWQDGEWEDLAPDWKGFLDTAIGDPETVEVLQNVCGNALTGHGSRYVKKFVALHGGTNAGKGVFMSAVASVLGELAQPISVGLLSGKRQAGPNSELAQLAGKRLAIVYDTGDAGVDATLMNGETLKQLTGGTDEIIARELYQTASVFRPSCLVFVGTNRAPDFPPNARAMYFTRMCYVAFKKKFSEDEEDVRTGAVQRMDKHLEEKFRRQRAGIFKWALVGAVRFLAMDHPAWGESPAMREDKADLRELLMSDYELFLERAVVSVHSPREAQEEAHHGCLHKKHGMTVAHKDLVAACMEYLKDRGDGERLPRVASVRTFLDQVMRERIELLGPGVARVAKVAPLGVAAREGFKDRRSRGWVGIGLTNGGYALLQSSAWRGKV